MTDSNTDVVLTEDFIKVINDLTNDLMNTFPDILSNDNPIKELSLLNDDTVKMEALIKDIYIYCKDNFPKYFFDILYENNELFEKDESLYLLPNIDFVELWKSDISDKTRSTIWKYLQLILFTVVSDVNTEDSFGDTAKLFEAINNDEFKQKIEASLHEMESIFKEKNVDISGNSEGVPIDLPNANDLHDHINKMMGGKIGCLAKEIAEETAGELDLDMTDATSVNDVFTKLFKNPTKLMDLVKNVGSKLDTKIKSGDLKESELLEEATQFVSNMKNMPGMSNLDSLFSKMGMHGMGGKVDMGALNREMEKNLKNAKMKERMRNKLNKKKSLEEPFDNNNSKQGNLKEKGINDFGMQELIYSVGEQPEKTQPKNKPRNKKKKKKPTVVTVDPENKEASVDLN